MGASPSLCQGGLWRTRQAGGREEVVRRRWHRGDSDEVDRLMGRFVDGIGAGNMIWRMHDMIKRTT